MTNRIAGFRAPLPIARAIVQPAIAWGLVATVALLLALAGQARAASDRALAAGLPTLAPMLEE
ncbi:MAG: hypothetical protein OXE80_08825, partial [Gammaproteobacteria bacterium]|nr:hypothetical protein [Gammaproteobacteria bacterium]